MGRLKLLSQALKSDDDERNPRSLKSLRRSPRNLRRRSQPRKLEKHERLENPRNLKNPGKLEKLRNLLRKQGKLGKAENLPKNQRNLDHKSFDEARGLLLGRSEPLDEAESRQFLKKKFVKPLC